MTVREIIRRVLLITLLVHMQEPSDLRIITFLRNEKGEVTGLSIDIGGRLRGVRFTKR